MKFKPLAFACQREWEIFPQTAAVQPRPHPVSQQDSREARQSRTSRFSRQAPLELEVYADAADDGRGLGLEFRGPNAGRRDYHNHIITADSPEIGIKSFGLERQHVGEGIFHTAAGNPARLELVKGCMVANRGAARDVSYGDTGGREDQGTVDRLAEAAAERAKGAQGSSAAVPHRVILSIGEVIVSFQTSNNVAKLMIVADRRADCCARDGTLI